MSYVSDLIDAEVGAYRARDLELFLDFFSHDVVVTDFDGNVLMKGIEGLRENYEPAHPPSCRRLERHSRLAAHVS